MSNYSIDPDPNPTEGDLVEIGKLTDKEISEIDSMLLNYASHRWKKMAYLVGRALIECDYKFTKIPDIYFAQRVRNLIESGHLVAQGYIENMRFCEVKLKEDESTKKEI